MAPISRAQTTLKSAHTAQTTAGKASKSVEKAQTALVSQQTAYARLALQMNGWRAELQIVGADPKKNGAAIADLQKKIFDGLPALTAQKEKVDQATQQVGAGRGALYDAENTALKAAKEANSAAAADFKPMPFLDAQYVDSIADAGSLSREKQRAILGADAAVDPRTAATIDGNKLSVAAHLGNGAEMLESVLRGTTEPRAQLELVKNNPRVIEAIVKRAGEQEATAQKLLGAINAAAPEARVLLLEGLVAAQGNGSEGMPYGLKRALGNDLGKGTSFETAKTLMKELKEAGKAGGADVVAHITAAKLGELRKDFEGKFKQTERLKGELARLNGGFQPLLDEPRQKAATEAFMKKHEGEFTAMKQSAADLAGALGSLEALDVSAKPGLGASGDAALKAEAAKVAKMLPTLQNTDVGGEAILKAMESRAPWLTSALDYSKTSKDLGEGMAKVVASSIALKALGGGAVQKDIAIEALGRLEHVLGAKGLDQVQKAFADLDGTPEAMKRAEAAFRNIDAGEFGASAVQKNTFKVLGLALSIPGVAQGVGAWDDASSLARVKTLVDSAKLSTDAAELLLGSVAKKSVLEGLSKVGTVASIVGGVIEGIQGGVTAFSDGKHLEGAGGMMSGAGGVMMGLAQLGMRVPGGQLIGAGLAVAGLITKMIAGNSAAREAEEAKEADAKAYLKGAGIKEPMATALSNIRRKDGINVGDVILQLAPEFKMEPKALLNYLLAHPDKLKGFVDQAFDLHAGADGKFDRQGITYPANGDQASKTYIGLDDVALWMRTNGMNPDGRNQYGIKVTD